MEHVVDLNEYISERDMQRLIDAGFDTSTSKHSLRIEMPPKIRTDESGVSISDLSLCYREVPTYTIAEILDRIPQEFNTNVGYDDENWNIAVYFEGECLTIIQSKSLANAAARVVYDLYLMAVMD